jgi:hypothetical protein
MTFLCSIMPFYLLLEHDLFRKPVTTFRDQLQEARIAAGWMQQVRATIGENTLVNQ